MVHCGGGHLSCYAQYWGDACLHGNPGFFFLFFSGLHSIFMGVRFITGGWDHCHIYTHRGANTYMEGTTISVTDFRTK